MRVGIVVTITRSDLWKKSEGWPVLQSFDQAAVRVATIGDDTLLILCQAKSNEISDPDRIRDSRRKTTPWLIELSNSKSYESAGIYIAAHRGFIDFNELRTQISNGRFAAGAEFSHQKESVRGVFDYLLALLDKMEKEAFEAVIDCISQRQVRTYADRLRTLKHRLADVFLPVSVDLWRWEEVGFDDVYLQQLRESYQTDEGRLDRARSLLYDELSGEDTVAKLLTETNLDDDDSWTAIQLLLPPKEFDDEPVDDEPSAYEKFLNARGVLESLKDRKSLLGLREKLRVNNTFGPWCDELYTHLSQLIDKVNC